MIVQCYALTSTKCLVGVSDTQMVCTKQDLIIGGGMSDCLLVRSYGVETAERVGVGGEAIL